MFEKVLSFFANALPVQERGIDPKDPQAFIRPNAPHVPLGKVLNGGWNELLFSLCRQAHDHKKAWTVTEDGEVFYDVYLVNLIQAEFFNRGVAITTEKIRPLLYGAQGHSDYVSKLARGCWDLELKAKN